MNKILKNWIEILAGLSCLSVFLYAAFDITWWVDPVGLPRMLFLVLFHVAPIFAYVIKKTEGFYND